MKKPVKKSKLKLTHYLTLDNISFIYKKIKKCVYICNDIIDSINRKEHISSSLVKVTFEKIREIMLEILNIILK